MTSTGVNDMIVGVERANDVINDETPANSDSHLHRTGRAGRRRAKARRNRLARGRLRGEEMERLLGHLNFLCLIRRDNRGGGTS